MAWLSGYAYRKSFTVSRASGAVTDYQIKLLIGESSGASGEQVDCGGMVASDFRDIRFTAADGEALLNYWIESITGTTPNQLATVWVKFDAIGTTDTTFYLYYGNSGASSASSGAGTFVQFDDFERGVNGDAIGGDWTQVIPSTTISTEQEWAGIAGDTRSAKLIGTGTSNYVQIERSLTPSSEVSVQFRVYKENAAVMYPFYHGNGTCRAYLLIDTSENLGYYNTSGTFVDTGANITADAWNLLECNNFNWSAYTYDIWLNGVKVATAAPMHTSASANGVVWIIGGTISGSDTYIDNFIVRKFYTTEPAVGTWGTVEQLETYSLITSGGVVVGGEFGLPYYLTTSGGVVVGGSSLYATGYKIDATAGLIAGGNIGLAYGYKVITSGGFLAGGTFTLLSGITMSGGVLVGGTSPLHTESGITTSGGFVAGANMVKKQVPYDLYSPAALAFGLTDASINFKLEQQP